MENLIFGDYLSEDIKIYTYDSKYYILKEDNKKIIFKKLNLKDLNEINLININFKHIINNELNKFYYFLREYNMQKLFLPHLDYYVFKKYVDTNLYIYTSLTFKLYKYLDGYYYQTYNQLYPQLKYKIKNVKPEIWFKKCIFTKIKNEDIKETLLNQIL